MRRDGDCHPLVAVARDFATRELRPRAGEFDRAGAVPIDVLRGMGERGLLGAMLPLEHGGGGLDALSYGLLTLEIGKGCSSCRALLTVHTSLVGETIARFGNAAQKSRWLPLLASGERLACFALSEPEVGSDAAAVRTTYERQGDHYVLDGRKTWISFALVADLMLVIAACGGSVSAFIVERDMPGVATRPILGMLGNRGAHIGEVFLERVRVPVENRLGAAGAGFGFIANSALFHGRYSVAWAGLALAEAALEEMVAYAARREQFGKKLREHQLVQALIANAVDAVHSGRALCERVGRLRDAGDDDAIAETHIAKYHTTRAASAVTADAVQLFGGNGCWDGYPVERLFREARILEVIEGTTQIQQIMLANHGMRRYRGRAGAAPAVAEAA